MNERGFTLVELLAVIGVLITISLIAYPSITSSLDRTKTKELEAKYKLIESSAEIFVTNNINSITTNNLCRIDISEITNLDQDNIIDPNTDNSIGGCVKYTKNNNNYEYTNECSNIDKCFN